jgi:hypothetical protein
MASCILPTKKCIHHNLDEAIYISIALPTFAFCRLANHSLCQTSAG